MDWTEMEEMLAEMEMGKKMDQEKMDADCEGGMQEKKKLQQFVVDQCKQLFNPQTTTDEDSFMELATMAREEFGKLISSDEAI